MTGKYVFLAAAWLAEVARIRDEHAASNTAPYALRMNQTITDVPFQSEPLEVFLDTSSGRPVLGPGRLGDPDVSVRLDWATCRKMLVFADAQAGMEAFMAGTITAEGDTSVLMTMAVAPTGDSDPAVIRAIQEITQ